MKNLLGFLLLTAVIFASCGDDVCFAEDWIGTYDLTSENSCDSDGSAGRTTINVD